MKIKSIKSVGRKKVYDISVENEHNYILENGVITHNSGILYSSDTVILITKSQDKRNNEIVGYNFNLNVMKGRHSREKSKIPLNVTFNGGINIFSGLLECAVASGDVVKPSNGWYSRVNQETGEVEEKKYRAADTNTHEFWDPVLKSEHFRTWIENTFGIANKRLIADGTPQPEIDSEFTVQEE